MLLEFVSADTSKLGRPSFDFSFNCEFDGIFFSSFRMRMACTGERN